jgi:hypothetical protein
MQRPYHKKRTQACLRPFLFHGDIAGVMVYHAPIISWPVSNEDKNPPNALFCFDYAIAAFSLWHAVAHANRYITVGKPAFGVQC